MNIHMTYFINFFNDSWQIDRFKVILKSFGWEKKNLILKIKDENEILHKNHD